MMKYLQISISTVVAMISMSAVAIEHMNVLSDIDGGVLCTAANKDMKSFGRSRVLYYDPDAYDTPPKISSSDYLAASVSCVNDGAGYGGELIEVNTVCDDASLQLFCCARLVDGQYLIYCKSIR